MHTEEKNLRKKLIVPRPHRESALVLLDGFKERLEVTQAEPPAATALQNLPRPRLEKGCVVNGQMKKENNK